MMFLARRYPLARLTDWRHELDWLLGQIPTGLNGAGSDQCRFPALNLWEDGERLYAEVEVPGFRMEDIEVSVMEDQLTICGRHESGANNGRRFHRQERYTREFARTVTLPVEVDPEQTEATLKDGVLTIVMPKAEAARARKIAVKAL